MPEKSTISWEDFVVRRNLNFETFKESQGIKTKEDLLRYCEKFNLLPPAEHKIRSLFPAEVFHEAPKQELKELKEEKQTKKSKGEKSQ